jgi:AsmA protein
MSALPLAAEGRIEADLADLADLAALMALPPPDLPAGWGGGRVAVTGALTLTAAQTLHLRGGVVTLDDRELRGDADLALGGSRPRLVAQVATGPLVLAAGGDTGGAAGGAAAGWSDAPIDASALGALDADIGFAAEALRIGPLSLGAVNGQLVIDRARAVLTLAEVAAYDGAMSGTLVANARDGLSVSADLAFRAVALQPLLTDLAGITRLSATGDLAVQVLGAGNSVAAILDRLSGSATVALGPGQIAGLDLPALLATLDPDRAGDAGATAFDSLSASFLIERGQMVNDDLVLGGRLVTATGQGRIGLATRDIDYRLRPVALTGADGTGGLGVPVRIAGPWSDPSVTLDLEGLARERLEDEVQAAEEAARARARELEDEARRKAAEELGAAPGESLEDAAKRRLEEELQRQIGNTLNELLGGN